MPNTATTGLPHIAINVSDGNLQRQMNNTEGTGAIIATAVSAMVNVTQLVYSVKDAEDKGITIANEPFLHELITAYYKELGAKQALYVRGFEPTTLMSALFDPEGVVESLLAESAGAITTVAICRIPQPGELAGSNFIVQDLLDAIIASKNTGSAQQAINRPVRFLLQGIINAGNNSVPDIHAYENPFAGVVIGNYGPNQLYPIVPLALARCCRYPCHVKIGNGFNGSLSQLSVKIDGAEVSGIIPNKLSQIAEKGFIVPHVRDGLAGYYFGRDNMATNGDYRILVHGRVIDKAQRIATRTFSTYLETEVEIEDNGNIKEVDAKHLEDILEQSVKANMQGQISNAKVMVANSQNIVNTSEVVAELQILPKGYLTWIAINIGLTTQINA